MLIHFVHDDKFIDMALREFELAAPGRNLPVMLAPAGPLKFVRSPAVRFMQMDEALQLVRANQCEGVILHTLQSGYLRVLRNVPPGRQVAWIGWGGDYYDSLLAEAYPEGLLLPETARLDRELQGPAARRMALALRRRAGRVLTALQHRRGLPRVDIFAPVIEPEHALARSLNPWFRARYVRWNYGTLEDDLLAPGDARQPGDDVLVGNSAFATNNHLEAFRLLKESCDLRGRRIVVPLSYGDSRYAQRVIEAGRHLFGPQVLPLTDFLDKDAYLRVLDACGFVVMNQVRQQALGNIYIMMMKGARIYLRRENPLLAWLGAQGAHLDPFEPSPDGRLALAPLAAEQKAGNARAVRASMSREVQRARTRRLVEQVLGGAATVASGDATAVVGP